MPIRGPSPCPPPIAKFLVNVRIFVLGCQREGGQEVPVVGNQSDGHVFLMPKKRWGRSGTHQPAEGLLAPAAWSGAVLPLPSPDWVAPRALPSRRASQFLAPTPNRKRWPLCSQIDLNSVPLGTDHVHDCTEGHPGPAGRECCLQREWCPPCRLLGCLRFCSFFPARCYTALEVLPSA